MRTAPTTQLRIHCQLRRTATYQMGCCTRCARLTKALALAPESLRFQGSRTSGSTRAWRTDRTWAATRRRAGLNHLSQCLRHWLPARDNQVSGPGDKPCSSIQSLRCTSQDMRSENHCTSPSLLRTTHQSDSVGQPGQSTTSIETPKVKNPDPRLHLMQHHLTLLHASFRGNNRIGSLDLLDSGGWVARSLLVHHQ